ncbi:MAG TPA: radical SAM protein [Kiritimatiellia bacterium]|nr:radical SAM protein [Kiritimatiellia bacterium]HRZ13255.1 radical SAM protein [Kiritimatiellia bacterium]HSA18704.1 radical SAM protein [Kiritimatiellia bacterium]
MHNNHLGMSAFQRVALVNVRLESRQRIPVNLLVLAACIKDRTRVTVFDPDPDQGDLRGLVEFQPDLVGISFMTQTALRAKELYDILRAALPSAHFVLGGVGPTVEKEAVFERFRPDAVVVGEGEKTLRRIVDGEPLDQVPGVYRTGRPFTPGEVIWNLDEIPLPAYECMPDFEKYLCPPGGIRGKWFDAGTPMIMTGRGCPYQCTFCSSHLMFTRKVRRRSVDNVLQEIRRLRNEYGIEAVHFLDDTFNAPPSWARNFCEALLREPYRLTWGCQVRVNLFDPDLARLMRKAGCVQVDIGVESGSPKVLKALKKGETPEQTAAAFRAAHEAGIAPMATFLVGCPEETMEDIELTRQLVKRIKPSFSEFYFLIPFPGSELFEQATANGWLKDRSYEGRGMVDRPVMEINFTMEQQVEIRRAYFQLVGWRNLAGFVSLNVLWAMMKSLRPSMVAAALKEFWKTRNLRDAMQAYVHALRAAYGRRAAQQRSQRAAP